MIIGGSGGEHRTLGASAAPEGTDRAGCRDGQTSGPEGREMGKSRPRQQWTRAKKEQGQFVLEAAWLFCTGLGKRLCLLFDTCGMNCFQTIS